MGSIPFFKLIHTDTEGTIRTLNRIRSITEKRALNAKKTDFQVQLRMDSPDANSPRFKTGGDLIFAEGDTIEFYLSRNSTVDPESDTAEISGEIEEIEIKYEERNRYLNLKITDRTVLLLSKQFPIYSKSPELNQAPELIQNLINHISETGTGESEIDATYDVNGGFIETTKHNGTSFDTITFSTEWKPAYDVIKELSQPKNTGDDRAYLFYVDDQNRFHWFYPDQTADKTITETDNEVLKIDLTKSTRDMVNMVIFNCGTDKNGNSVYDYWFDPTVETAKLKMSYENWSGITDEMRSPVDPFDWSGSTNTQVRNEAKDRGLARAQDLTAAMGDPRWKGKIRLHGTKEYNPGDLIKITSYSYGLDNKKLRVQDVHQDIGGGWTTTLQLDEDEEAVTS